jgi:hypothetical protein
VRDGVRTLRRVKTGHATSQEGKDVGAAAFVLAARAAFPDAVVELVYLADAEAKPLVLSARELSGRQAKLGKSCATSAVEPFRAEASDMTCPNCPAFFVCGAVPPGTSGEGLLKKFTGDVRWVRLEVVGEQKARYATIRTL